MRRYHYFAPFIIVIVSVLFISCGGSSSSTVDYNRTISEGRKAANELLEQTGASSFSVALVADNRIVWTETFGLADKEKQLAPTVDTMFGIGSTSKMLATVATMQLVDEGKVSLYEPVTTYIPTFSMLSPQYSQITVRMLLNHSAGFPGTDYFNAITLHPYPEYLDQMQDSLHQARLKYSPGYMNLYANDGFTLIQQLVANVTGKAYSRYVQEKIFTPLNMNHSRYVTETFPAGSYAETYAGTQKNPFLAFNNYASGGLYTTPTDLARLALMFLSGGTYNGNRILSAASINAMATDQTLGTFNPVPSEYFRFGLGWDSISEGGLKAVNLTAWSKGGDIGAFGAELLIVPEKKLSVAVIGASGSFSSASATALAEQIALQALVDQGDLAEMPAKLVPTPLAEKEPTPEKIADMTGYFAGTAGALIRSSADANNAIQFYSYDGNDWIAEGDPLKMRIDGMFSRDANPLIEYYTVEDQEEFMAIEYPAGYGHYRDKWLGYQKVDDVTPLSDAWRNRLGKTWLLVNEQSDNVASNPLFTLSLPEGLQGLLTVNDHDDEKIYVVDPSHDEMRAYMMPFTARDINDVVIFSESDGEWIRYGSKIYRPKESVVDISNGGTVEIGEDGYAQWRSVNGGGKTITVTINSIWRVYDSAFKMIAETDGTGSVTLDSADKYYVIFFGQNGDTVTVAVQ